MFSDSEIIEGCRKNKHTYQMALFDKYAPMLRAVCCRYVPNSADADDLLQESFIKILGSIGRYSETGSFRAWMKRIVINGAINFIKKKKQLQFLDIDAVNSGMFSNDDGDEANQRIENKILEANIPPEEIIQLIQELPTGYGMVLNMYIIDQLSHKEIAEALSISVNTSKSQLSRARRLLLEKTEELIAKKGVRK